MARTTRKTAGSIATSKTGTARTAAKRAVGEPARAKQVGAKQAGEEKAPGRHAAKQAVVIIHGMGEQRPMETLRSFVRAVWMEDYEFCRILPASTSDGPLPAGSNATDEEVAIANARRQIEEKELGEGTWITPATGKVSGKSAHEDIRITTGHHESGETGRARKRTDFYELYWADAMNGNSLATLRRWASGLFVRPFASIPKDVFALWVGLWIALLLVLFLLLIAYPKVLPGASMLSALVDKSFKEWVRDIFTTGYLGYALFWLLVLGAIPAFVVMQAFVQDHLLARKDYSAAKFWKVAVFQFAVLGAIAIAVGILTWLAHKQAVPKDLFFLVAGLFAAGLVYAINAFFVPYFGDVARYVQSATDTVAQRNEIRERGLTLLRQLHASDEYDRIVVASHSLGSVVAYDLIRLFWAEHGATMAAGTDLTPPVQDRFHAVARFGSADKPEDWTMKTMTDYRATQKAAFVALRDQQAVRRAEDPTAKVWKISDLVTVGSPLTHADFLIARDEQALESLQKERSLPVNPPLFEDGANQVAAASGADTYLYGVGGGRDRKVYAHHAAPFAVVRWTNIYDWRRAAILGDFVSGPLRHHFGAGILDFRVKMERLSRRFFINHLVTHTLYWTQWAQDNWARANHPIYGDKRQYVASKIWEGHTTPEAHALMAKAEPVHLRLLRAACDLKFGEDAVCDPERMFGYDGASVGDDMQKITGLPPRAPLGVFLSGFVPVVFYAVATLAAIAAAAWVLAPEAFGQFCGAIGAWLKGG